LRTSRDKGIEKLRKVIVYRRGDRVVVGEYFEKHEEDNEHDRLIKKHVEEYTKNLKKHYDRLLDSVKERAYKEAYEQGYEDGYRESLNELGEKLQSVIDNFVGKLNELVNDLEMLKSELELINRNVLKERDKYLREIEKELLMFLPELISEITKDIGKKALTVDEEFLKGYVEKVISKLKGSEIIELRVPSKLYDRVSKIVDGIIEKDINIRNIIVNSDIHVEDGMIADSQLGLVDGRLSSVIDNLKKSIREVVGFYAQQSTEHIEE